jgi:nitrite reductase (NADH) small subunit
VSTSGDWIRFGMLDQIPLGGSRVLARAEGDIAIFRTASDHVFALRDSCPHQGAPLSQGFVFDGYVACPLHDWLIELATGAVVTPNKGCALRYAVRIEQGVVWVSPTPTT